jgi:hypothetical protein
MAGNSYKCDEIFRKFRIFLKMPDEHNDFSINGLFKQRRGKFCGKVAIAR